MLRCDRVLDLLCDALDVREVEPVAYQEELVAAEPRAEDVLL